MNSKARISAIGTYVPAQRLKNDDLEKMVDTNDQWIVQRTGMRERRIAGENEFSSHLAIRAVEDLQNRYNVEMQDVDFVIVSTTTSDYAFPSVACRIQEYFHISQAGAFDLNATCAGFTYGLHMANALITSGLHRKVLVVASETLSKVTDYTDRTTCILFGDGAAAILVEWDEEHPSFISSYMGTNGEGGFHLYRTALSETMNGEPLQANGKMIQNGREVYKWAVRTVPAGIQALLEQSGLQKDEIDWFVPHSANLRMIESICERTEIPIEKTLTSVEYMGNTSSVSIPLAIDLAVKEGKIRSRDNMLLYGYGGGLTHLGLLIKWNPIQERK